MALLIGVNRKTITRKILFLRLQAKFNQRIYLEKLKKSKPTLIQFDEMESFERSKLLPVSIPIVVDEKTRKILGLKVCRMPAKGLLAERSRKKYGHRKDERKEAASALFSELKEVIHPEARILSDQNPKYPSWIKAQFPKRKFPKLTHETIKGERGCVVGQGELKRGGYDPLFSLNHTAAMIRANVSRMVRRTWCTTKKLENLEAHLLIYMDYHNRVLT